MPQPFFAGPPIRSLWNRRPGGGQPWWPHRQTGWALGTAAELWAGQRATVVCSADDGEDDLDVGDDDNLTGDDPLADEESSFDDFDDDFDDDFEEEETDPDWDHPDDLEPEAPPPGKPSGGKK
jgi:hypothetical protein